MMNLFLETLHNLDTLQVWGFFGVANLVIFGVSVVACWGLGRWFEAFRIFDHWERFSALEGLAALASVGLNTAVSVVGWKLWVEGAIHLTAKPLGGIVFDTVLMTLAMDFGMYWLHRAAHWPWLFRTFHAFHHRHEVTNPISLFVLHPLEVLGFGGLMIAVLALLAIDPWALVAYLTLNVIFGTLGHSGVEPFPRVLSRIPLIRWVGTSTFHAEHHERPGYNFGFYSLIWDQLFGTLDPRYWQRYQGAAGRRGA